MPNNEQVLNRIKELIPQAPTDWIERTASEMGKSTDSVYAYCGGRRGLKKGQHKEVLRILNRLVEEEQAETIKLIGNKP